MPRKSSNCSTARSTSSPCDDVDGRAPAQPPCTLIVEMRSQRVQDGLGAREVEGHRVAPGDRQQRHRIRLQLPAQPVILELVGRRALPDQLAVEPFSARRS